MLLAMHLARDMTAQRVGLKPVLEPRASQRVRPRFHREGLALVLVTTLGVLTSWAQAATFDCHKASSFVEKVICSDSRLTSMDD
jgi:hypothetical protein